MSDDSRLILVTGATGRQGGATARCLLDSGLRVRFLTRDSSKPAAAELVGRGAEVWQGDLNNEPDVRLAVRGVYGVFGVQDSHEHGPIVEVEQGKRLATLARDTGVQHFVYTSVGAADRNTGIPLFESKWEIENHIRSLGLQYTILRPVFFMDNLLAPDFRDQIADGTLSTPLKSDTRLQLIAVSDIGAAACVAFQNPGEWAGKEIDLAGDALTMREMSEHLSLYVGAPVTFREASLEPLWAANPGFAKMFQWFIDHGYDVDIPRLRQTYPQLQDFDRWLETSGLPIARVPLHKAA